MPFFALALVSSSPWWCLLCIRYGRIRLSCRYVRACGNSDQMALPSVDFLNPLPLCLFVLTFKFVVLFSNSFLMLFKVHLNLREVLYIHQIKHHTKGVLDNE